MFLDFISVNHDTVILTHELKKKGESMKPPNWFSCTLKSDHMRPLYFQVLKTLKKLLFTHGITARLFKHFHFSHSLGLLVSSSKCFFFFFFFFFFFVTETLSKFGARRWLCGLWFSSFNSFRGLALEAQIEACASKWCVVIFHIHTYLHISHESVPNPSHGWKV